MTVLQEEEKEEKQGTARMLVLLTGNQNKFSLLIFPLCLAKHEKNQN